MSPDDIDSLVGEVVKPKPKPVRLLFYDIETAPKTSYLWDMKVNGWVGTHMLLSDVFILSYATKWSDNSKPQSGVLTPSEARGQDDSRIVKSLSHLVKQADYVVAHNGDSFDLPILNARMAANNLGSFGHVQTIDTLKMSRSAFGKGIASHSLDFLAGFFGFDGKHSTTFSLWDQSYRGHGPSLKQMAAYNRQDVILLEQVFHALKPYAKNLPRLVDAGEYRQEHCTSCGSDERKKDGYHRTKVNTFQRYRCLSCGRRYRGWQAIGSKKSGSIGL